MGRKIVHLPHVILIHYTFTFFFFFQLFFPTSTGWKYLPGKLDLLSRHRDQRSYWRSCEQMRRVFAKWRISFCNKNSTWCTGPSAGVNQSVDSYASRLELILSHCCWKGRSCTHLNPWGLLRHRISLHRCGLLSYIPDVFPTQEGLCISMKN